MEKPAKFYTLFSKFVFLTLFFVIFSVSLVLDKAAAADSQLRAEIGPNQSYVILENSQIFVKYLPYTSVMSYQYTYFMLDYSDGTNRKNDFDDWGNIQFDFFKNTDLSDY